MTKALIEIDSELWKQARVYALQNDLTVNELVTIALERLVHPVAGRQTTIENSKAIVGEVVDRIHLAHNVTPMPVEEIERRTAPRTILDASQQMARLPSPSVHPGYGHFRPAPKPMKRK